MDDAIRSHISAHDHCGIVQLNFYSSAIDYDPWARPYTAHNNLCSLDIFQVNGGGRRRWNLKQGRISISQLPQDPEMGVTDILVNLANGNQKILSAIES
jgi:hypothetical protein